MEKIIHANRNQERAGEARFVSDKMDFKPKMVTKDKGGHYIMIKGQLIKKT